MTLAIDVGGYHGQFLYGFDQVGCDKIICIEPSEKYFSMCAKVARDIESEVILVNKALHKTGFYALTDEGDASNILSGDPTVDEIVDGISFIDLIKRYDLKHANYVKLNCEGSEFVILQDILELDFDVDEFFVQFHGNDELRDSILKKFMEKGYDVYSHQRTENGTIFWWSIIKKNMERIFGKSSPVVKPYSI